MERFPTATPETFAKVDVREAAHFEYGDRILYLRGGGRWAEFLTVLDVSADEDFYVTVRYVFDNDTLDGSFVTWGRTMFAVLTPGVCDNPHSGMALMCTPAPYRLDAKPWPGHSSVCDAHKDQMRAAHALNLPPR